MGGRGQSSASNGFLVNTTFDKNLIERANIATWSGEGGNSAVNSFKKNLEEIKNTNLTSQEKDKAIKTQRELTEKYLKTVGDNPSILATGAGGFKGSAQSGVTKILKAQAKINDHMNSIREKQRRIIEKRKNEKITQIVKKAIENGDLKIVIDGETWIRKTTRSKTFYSVD